MNKLMATGGSASGKSEWVENQAALWSEQSGRPVIYIATATVADGEFAERVRRHKERRPPQWGLEETPADLPAVLESYSDRHAILLLDSLGTWLSGLMWRGGQEKGWDTGQKTALHDEIGRLVRAVAEYKGACLLVADEVGLGIVPENEMGRLFRDLNGLLNRRLAEVVDEAYLISCGLPVKLK